MQNNTEKGKIEQEYLLSQFIDFFQNSKTYIGILYLLFFAVYGSWAYTYFVSFDAEGQYRLSDANRWYTSWIYLGRWGFYYLKRLLNVELSNPYYSIAVFLICFPLSAVIWSFVLQQWLKIQKQVLFFVFSIVYLTQPIWALQFAYRNQIEACSIVMCFLPVGMVLFSTWQEKPKLLYLICSIFFVTYSFGSYQSFLFVYGAAFLLYLLALFLQNLTLKQIWKKFCFGVLFTIICFGLYVLITKILVYVLKIPDTYGSYLSDQFRWGKEPFSTCILRVKNYLKNGLYGNGVEFTGWYGFLFLLSILCLCGKANISMVHKFFCLILLGGMLIIPFALDIVTAGTIVSRSRFAYVFVLAVMVFLVLLEGNSFIRPQVIRYLILLFLFVRFLLPQIEILDRLLYTDARTMRDDYQWMEHIYFKAKELGAEDGMPLAFLGDASNVDDETMLNWEIVGESYFEVLRMYQQPIHSNKTVEAMQSYGFPFTQCTPEQVELAVSVGKDMKACWPRAGGIKIVDGVVIVKLSEQE